MASPFKANACGRTVVMTGATDGIGRVAAARIAEAGADLVVVARDRSKAAKLVRAIPSARIVIADLADLNSVRAAAEELSALPRIDVLINNAGVMKNRLTTSVDGFEMNIAVNHLAVVALTLPLLDRLIASGAGARIVNTNSAGHAAALQGGFVEPSVDTWRGEDPAYSFSMAYSRSKLANLLWGYELADRLRGTGVTLNALHPGSVRTGLGRELPRYITEPYHLLFSTSLAKGAAPLVRLALDGDVAGVTGAYFDQSRQVRSSPASYNAAYRQQVWRETSRALGIDLDSIPV